LKTLRSTFTICLAFTKAIDAVFVAAGSFIVMASPCCKV
jgi:hypothetical protein